MNALSHIGSCEISALFVVVCDRVSLLHADVNGDGCAVYALAGTSARRRKSSNSVYFVHTTDKKKNEMNYIKSNGA